METDNNKAIVVNNYDEDKYLYELYDFMGKPEVLKDMFFASDKPLEYKGIMIYPVTMKYYMVFNVLISCLTLHKNISGDIKAIGMSYLDYLFYLAEQGKEMYVMFLEKLLLLVLHKNAIAYGTTGEPLLKNGIEPIRTIEFINRKGKWTINILKDEVNLYDEGLSDENYIILNSNDFEEVRQIICSQNNIELLSDDTHPDKIKKIEEWEELQSKRNKDKVCSLEDRKAILKVVKGWTTEQVDKMTIRSFQTEFERLGILIDYNLGTILSPNIAEKDRKKIINWLGKIKKLSKLERITADYNKFNDQFNPNKKQS